MTSSIAHMTSLVVLKLSLSLEPKLVNNRDLSKRSMQLKNSSTVFFGNSLSYLWVSVLYINGNCPVIYNI